MKKDNVYLKISSNNIKIARRRFRFDSKSIFDYYIKSSKKGDDIGFFVCGKRGVFPDILGYAFFKVVHKTIIVKEAYFDDNDEFHQKVVEPRSRGEVFIYGTTKGKELIYQKLAQDFPDYVGENRVSFSRELVSFATFITWLCVTVFVVGVIVVVVGYATDDQALIDVGYGLMVVAVVSYVGFEYFGNSAISTALNLINGSAKVVSAYVDDSNDLQSHKSASTLQYDVFAYLAGGIVYNGIKAGGYIANGVEAGGKYYNNLGYKRLML